MHIYLLFIVFSLLSFPSFGANQFALNMDQSSMIIDINRGADLSRLERLRYDRIRQEILSHPRPCDLCDEFSDIDYEFQLQLLAEDDYSAFYELIQQFYEQRPESIEALKTNSFFQLLEHPFLEETDILDSSLPRFCRNYPGVSYDDFSNYVAGQDSTNIVYRHCNHQERLNIEVSISDLLNHYREIENHSYSDLENEYRNQLLYQAFDGTLSYRNSYRNIFNNQSDDFDEQFNNCLSQRDPSILDLLDQKNDEHDNYINGLSDLLKDFRREDFIRNNMIQSFINNALFDLQDEHEEKREEARASFLNAQSEILDSCIREKLENNYIPYEQIHLIQNANERERLSISFRNARNNCEIDFETQGIYEEMFTVYENSILNLDQEYQSHLLPLHTNYRHNPLLYERHDNYNFNPFRSSQSHLRSSELANQLLTLDSNQNFSQMINKIINEFPQEGSQLIANIVSGSGDLSSREAGLLNSIDINVNELRDSFYDIVEEAFISEEIENLFVRALDKHLEKVDQSLLSLCEQNAQTLHLNQSLNDQLLISILNSSSDQDERTSKLMSFQGAYCHMLRRYPSGERDLELVDLGIGLGAIAVGTGLQFIPGVGNLVGTGLILGGGSYLAKDALDIMAHNEFRLQEGIALNANGWADYDEVLRRAQGRSDARINAGIEVGLIPLDIAGVGLSLRALRQTSRAVPRTTSLSPAEIPLREQPLDSISVVNVEQIREIEGPPIDMTFDGGLIRSSVFRERFGSDFQMITLGQFNQLPDGNVLYGIDGQRFVKGMDDIELNPRGEYLPLGFRVRHEHTEITQIPPTRNLETLDERFLNTVRSLEESDFLRTDEAQAILREWMSDLNINQKGHFENLAETIAQNIGQVDNPHSVVSSMQQSSGMTQGDALREVLDFYSIKLSSLRPQERYKKYSRWVTSNEHALFLVEAMRRGELSEHPDLLRYLIGHNDFFRDVRFINHNDRPSIITYSFEKETRSELIDNWFFDSDTISQRPHYIGPLQEEVVYNGENLWEVTHRGFEINPSHLMDQVRSVSNTLNERHSFHVHLAFPMPLRSKESSRFNYWAIQLDDFMQFRGMEEGLHNSDYTNLYQRDRALEQVFSDEGTIYVDKMRNVGVRNAIYGKVDEVGSDMIGLELRDVTRNLDTLDSYVDNISSAISDRRWMNVDPSDYRERILSYERMTDQAVGEFVEFAPFFRDMNPLILQEARIPFMSFETALDGTLFNYRTGELVSPTQEQVSRFRNARDFYKNEINSLESSIRSYHDNGIAVDDEEIQGALRMILTDWARRARVSELFENY